MSEILHKLLQTSYSNNLLLCLMITKRLSQRAIVCSVQTRADWIFLCHNFHSVTGWKNLLEKKI